MKFILKHMRPLRLKRWILHYIAACMLCWDYGERATPSAIQFVWSIAEPDWDSVTKDPEWNLGRVK